MDDVSLSVSLTFEYVFNLYIYCYVSPVLRFLEAIKMRATCVHELQNKKVCWNVFGLSSKKHVQYTRVTHKKAVEMLTTRFCFFSREMESKWP